ncbi:alpha/beta fold hydrolase [Celeribacter indicus]|uniref:Hydrolase, alpha/beta fold family protein n=1 Tax=Celeribacter indicus TaxID=1208324 RepID=A0A0B5DYV3_9RHOB|nr:alpha/beta hydrolase [Celeribacter indicus]AJE48608.1 hydrolase, alpha/beta fold family protein [Celeribacter indicus]SDX09625.1 N-formylmaleamate deformylase [Celeribacter indicus]
MGYGYNLHANGIRHHLIRYEGQGPKLLLIPGITSPAITWGFVAERLADAFDVHVLDVRGRGLSETGDLDYTLDAMAADALALAEIMGQPVVMGHSMGARTAIRAAATVTDAFRGAILVDPPVSGPNRRPYPSAWPWYGDSIRMAAKGCSAEDMRTYCPSWSEEQRALRAEWLHTCHWGAIRTAYDGFHTDDIHADLPKIAIPTRLVIAGGAPVIQDEDEAELRELLPAMEVRTVEGAGHMIPWDDIEGFLAATLDFKA